MSKDHRHYWKMREDQQIRVERERAGRYRISDCRQGSEWKVWRGVNGRWYGECRQRPGQMIDAPTLQCAKNDIRMDRTVACASAGL